MMPAYFVAYLTANDSASFHIDYFNLRNMFRHHPGVEHIHFYMAISEVQKFSILQKKIIRSMLQLAGECKWITCEAVILKPNTGRDFSSLRECLNLIQDQAHDEDYIFVRNRSSRGPFRDGWYKEYVSQFETNPHLGMVGSTINLNDHYERGLTANASHVQSYVFLSKWKFLSRLLNDFPGVQAITHIDAVIDGEIELSQRILRNGGYISSLQKPDMVLEVHSQNDSVQSTIMPSVSFDMLPIIHRKREKRGLSLWIKRLGYFNMIPLFVKNKVQVKFIEKY